MEFTPTELERQQYGRVTKAKEGIDILWDADGTELSYCNTNLSVSKAPAPCQSF